MMSQMSSGAVWGKISPKASVTVSECILFLNAEVTCRPVGNEPLGVSNILLIRSDLPFLQTGRALALQEQPDTFDPT